MTHFFFWRFFFGEAKKEKEMKSIYNVPQVRTQQTTALTNIGNLLDVTITGAQNNDILVYESPKWINKPQIINNNQDVNAVNPLVNEVLFHNGTEWINKEIALDNLSDVVIPVLPSTNQVLTFDGDYWTPQTLASSNFSTLNDVQITAVQNNDNIVYDSTAVKYINKKKYSQFDFFVELSNTTVTGAIRTIYFCNLATVNLPASTAGEQIKIINASGPLCTFAYTGLIYHLDGHFNTSFSTVDACQIVLTGIIGGNWQISNFTGRWVDNSTNIRLANNNLEDLRNMSIILPANNNFLKFDGSAWVNANLPAETVYLKKYVNYFAPNNVTTTLVVNSLYQSFENNFTMPNSVPGSIITIMHIQNSGPTRINFGATTVLYTLSVDNYGPLWIETNEIGASITLVCINGDIFTSYWYIEDCVGEWTTSFSTKKITSAYINIDNLKNMAISAPSTGQFLSYDSSLNAGLGAWTNTTLERCHPTSELYIGGAGTTFATTLTTVNVWYQFAHPTTIVNNPSANGIFARNNANLFQWTYTGTNAKYYHAAFSISSASNDANDTYEAAFFINNAIVPGSQFIVDFAQNNRAISTAFHKVLVLNTNDLIDIRMRNVTAGGKIITANNVNLCALACCSLS